jgi:hypothetical protein
VFAYGTVVYCGTIGMVRGAGGTFGSGVVLMGMAGVTMLQPQEIGKQRFPFTQG